MSKTNMERKLFAIFQLLDGKYYLIGIQILDGVRYIKVGPITQMFNVF